MSYNQYTNNGVVPRKSVNIYASIDINYGMNIMS